MRDVEFHRVRQRLQILVVDPLHQSAIAKLSQTHDVHVQLRPRPDELIQLVSDVDVLVLRSGVKLTDGVIQAARSLKLIARAGVGTDNIDLAAARARGITVFNVPSASAGAVAELSLGLLLAVARHVALADRQIRDGLWKKPELTGRELSGKTIGLLGLGAIGSRLAQLLQGFDARILATVAHVTDQRRAECAARGIELTTFENVLRDSDAISLQLPLQPATRGMISTTQLRHMKRSAYLINVSRAGVVDDDALYDALATETIAGAGIDVHAVEGGASRFSALHNVVLTPHIGAMTDETQWRIGQAVLNSITAWSQGEPIANRVC